MAGHTDASAARRKQSTEFEFVAYLRRNGQFMGGFSREVVHSRRNCGSGCVGSRPEQRIDDADNQVFALLFREEGSETVQPLATADERSAW